MNISISKAIFLLIIILNIFLINGNDLNASDCENLVNEFLTGKLELYDIIQQKSSNFINKVCNNKKSDYPITSTFYKGIKLLIVLLNDYYYFLGETLVNECYNGFCEEINKCPLVNESLLVETYNINHFKICGMNPLKVCCDYSSNLVTDLSIDIKQITKVILEKKRKEFYLNTGPLCQYQKNLTGTCLQIQNCPYILNEYKNGNFKEENLIFCQLNNNMPSICCPNIETTGSADTNVIYLMEIMSVLPKKYSRISQRVCSKYLAKRLKIEEVLTIMESDVYVPHLGALYTKDKAKICSGFLINEYFLITAAHCIIPDLSYVTLGLSDTTYQHYKTYSIKRIIIHEEYNLKYTYNDIALLRLNESVVMNLFVRPACLNSDNDMPNINSKLFLAGWVNLVDVAIRNINLKMFPLEQCNATYLEQMKNHKIGADKRGLDYSVLCAQDPLFSEASENELLNDACAGDSGGPLQAELKKYMYIVYGIVAHGLPCGLSMPGIYTRISHHLNWIENHVWPNAV